MRLIDADDLNKKMEFLPIRGFKGEGEEVHALVSLSQVLNIIDQLPTLAVVVKEKSTKLEKAMDRPIEALDLSVRVFNCLKRYGIRTISELYEARENRELPKVRNLGRTGLREIETKLGAFLERSKE